MSVFPRNKCSKVKIPSWSEFGRDSTFRSRLTYNYLSCNFPNGIGHFEFSINASGADCGCYEFRHDNLATESSATWFPWYNYCVPNQGEVNPFTYYSCSGNGVFTDTPLVPADPVSRQQYCELLMLPYELVQDPCQSWLVSENSSYPGTNMHCAPQQSNTGSSTVRDRILVYVPTYGDDDISTSKPEYSEYSNPEFKLFDVGKRAIIVKHVPSSLNKVGLLCDFFKKFGPIVRIDVQFGNSESARIEFEKADDASRAYSSSIPVLGNRFIEVLWEDEMHVLTKGSDTCEDEIRKNLFAESKERMPSKCDKINFSQNVLRKKSSAKTVLQKRKLAFIEKCKKLEKLLSRKQVKSSALEDFQLCNEFVNRCKSNISYFQTAGKVEGSTPTKSRPNGDQMKKTMLKDLLDLEMDIYYLEKRSHKPLDLMRKVTKLEEELMAN